MSLKDGTNLMKLLGQMTWELVEFFGEVIWQMMATIQIIAVLVIVGVIIEHLISTRTKDRRPTHWKSTDGQNEDY
jgi:hypothetical protein